MFILAFIAIANLWRVFDRKGLSASGTVTPTIGV